MSNENCARWRGDDDTVLGVLFPGGGGIVRIASFRACASFSSPSARAVDGGTASVGGVSAPVEFAGLPPGFVGFYQGNIRIPDNVPPGDAVELYLEQNQIGNNRVMLVIR